MGDADRGRGLGHPVQIGQRRGATATVAIRCPHHHGRSDVEAAILLQELLERRHAQARDKDRLVLLDQAYLDETARRIEHHQEVDRSAGKTGQGRQRLGLEHIARGFAIDVDQRVHPGLVDLFAQQQRRFDIAGDLVRGQRISPGSQGRQHQAEGKEKRAHGAKARPGFGAKTLDQGLRGRALARGPDKWCAAGAVRKFEQNA